MPEVLAKFGLSIDLKWLVHVGGVCEMKNRRYGTKTAGVDLCSNNVLCLAENLNVV